MVRRTINTNQEENHPPFTTTTTFSSMSDHHLNQSLHPLLNHNHNHNTFYLPHTPSPGSTPTSIFDVESTLNRLNLNPNNNNNTTLPNHLQNTNNFPSYQSSASSYRSLPTTPLYSPRTTLNPFEFSFDQVIPPPVLPLPPYDNYDISALIQRIQIQDALIQRIIARNSSATNPYTPARSNNEFLINRLVVDINNGGLVGRTQFRRSGVLSGAGRGSMDLGLGIEYKNLDYMRLEEFRGKIAFLAKTQHGCRFLEDKIEEGRYEDVKIIFNEIKAFMSELVVDQFGYYLVQKLFKLLNEHQLNEILYSVTSTDDVLEKICQNSHGTSVMQKLLLHLSTPLQFVRIVNALIPITVHVSTDFNGHNVIQHCVKHFSIEYTQYLLEEVAANCVIIAMDSNGCCVLQTCVDHAQGEIMEHLVNEITRYALDLANDPYGNYVVQHILEKKIPLATLKLLKKFEGKFASLSTQKFSSNVVEKCLKESNEEQREQIIKELINGKDILPLLQDQFGNYVIQTALLVATKTPIFNVMVERIRMHYTSLRSHPYGKRIIDKMDSFKKQKMQSCTIHQGSI